MEDRPPLVRCTGCERAWMSATMAEGLRLLGECPRCAGTLEFRDAPAPAAADPAGHEHGVAPHLVLGMPKRY